jgi:hypothetical protein
MKKWWVVYKVNPEIHTRRYDEYMERNEKDVYQEEIEEGENFTISDGARLRISYTWRRGNGRRIRSFKKTSLKITWSPKKSLQKSQQMIERCERLNTRVIEADSDVDDF